jgi:O-antigen/teichoic acid export membrane protein
LSTGTSKILAATPAAFPAEKAARRPRALGSVAAVVQSMGAKFFIIAINAATGILTARALQPAGRGALAAMILWPIFLASALTFGLPSALTFRLRSNPEKRSQLLGAALLLATLTGVIGSLAGVIFMHAWIPQYSHEVIQFARLFALYAPMTAVLLIGRAALESHGDFTASNKLIAIPPALTLLWLIILWRTGTLTPVNAAFAYVVVGVPPFLWMLRLLWCLFRPSLNSFTDSARSLLTYGIRAYGIDLCGTMAMYIDQALVVRALAPQMMGTYVVALSLSRILNAFHASVVMVLFPKSVNQPAPVVRAMTSRAARISTLLTALAGVGIVSFGPGLLSLLYGREYSGASTVLRILVVEVVLAGATYVLAQAFMALERPGIITSLQVIGLLLTLPLMLILVPRFGIVGAALALLASTTARLIFVLVSFPLFLKMQVPNVFLKTEDLKFMAAQASQALRRLRNKPLVSAEGTD